MPAPVCTALNLHDKSRCTEGATSLNSKFCSLHSRQVQGLYNGYKRRSADLEALDAAPPKSLPANLQTTDFSSVESTATIHELHTYLLRKQTLQHRVILAREYHHSHFYADDSDWGHQAYLDRVSNARSIVVRALARLDKRTHEVLYGNEKWFSWVREQQDSEEAKSVGEKKKVKAEAVLFREHQAKMKYAEARILEEEKEKRELEEVWDPIEAIVEENRRNYIRLLKIYMTGVDDDEATEGSEMSEMVPLARIIAGLGRSRTLTKALQPLRLGEGKKSNKTTVESGDKSEHEKDMEKEERFLLYSNEKMKREILHIQETIFRRIILSNPSLLPAALSSSSIDAFLANPQVRPSDLRDLCIQMARVTPGQIRDACADCHRSEPEPRTPFSVNIQGYVRVFSLNNRPREDLLDNENTTGGTTAKDGKSDRVKICGEWIYNYPSEARMPRRGWVQWAVLCPNISFGDSVGLCKSWDEFYEFSILHMFGYLRGHGGFSRPVDDEQTMALNCLGFISFGKSSNAEVATGSFQSSRRTGRRVHSLTEARNYIAASMKADNPATLRFLNELQTWKTKLVVWARDARTGEVFIDPPEEEKWFVRDKKGVGRASKNEWTIRHSMSREFLAEMEKTRKWKFGFKDYYDVIVWDRVPGLPNQWLPVLLLASLNKANRCRDTFDSYRGVRLVLADMHKDMNTEEINLGCKPTTYPNVLNKKELLKEKEFAGIMSVEKNMQFLFYDSLDEDEESGLHPGLGGAGGKDESIRDEDAGRERLRETDPEGDELYRYHRSVEEDEEDEKEMSEEKTLRYYAEDYAGPLPSVHIAGAPPNILDTAENPNMKLSTYDPKILFKEFTSQDERLKDTTLMSHTLSCAYLMATTMIDGSQDPALGVRLELQNLLDQEKRAAKRPKCRSMKQPEGLFRRVGLDEKIKDTRTQDPEIGKWPREWHRAVRRLVAELRKDGAIRSSWLQGGFNVFPAREFPGGKTHLWCDYRKLEKALMSPVDSGFMEAPPPPSTYLLEEAHKYADKRPNACYCLLRLWSADTWWPTSLGVYDANGTMFVDADDRVWEWVRAPKDMPYTEYTIHHTLKTLLESHELDDYARVRIDTYLVMSPDSTTLKDKTSFIMALVEGQQGMKIDLRRSFFNVGVEFLDRLAMWWWE